MSARLSQRLLKTATVSIGALVLAVPGGAAPAFAEGPHWHITSSATPTNLPPGGEGTILVTVSNLGDQAAQGGAVPVTVADVLPPELTATAISGLDFSDKGLDVKGEHLKCSLSPTPGCTWAEPVSPYGILQMSITVKVNEPAGTKTSLPTEVKVDGGETPRASLTEPVGIDGSPPRFGLEQFSLTPENEDGSLDTQAGSHPFQLTTSLGLTTTLETRGQSAVMRPAALPRNLHINLPAGLIGNPGAVPQCTSQEFTTIGNFANFCPPDTAVGVVSITLAGVNRFGGGVPFTESQPLFNLTPAPGEPARLGFLAFIIPVVLDTAVRTGGDYGVNVSANNILQTAGLISARVTVWGVPGDPRHDGSRGWGCLHPLSAGEGCVPAAQSQPSPLLTLPTSCAGALESSADGESWAAPGKAPEIAPSLPSTLRDATGNPLGLEGCGRLPFSPAISVQPEGHAGSTPTGLSVDMRVPQESTLSASGLAEADVDDTTVVLPEGMQVDPSSANGLEACSASQAGFSSVDSSGTTLFSPTLPEPFCPDASKVGVVRIKTPLLPHELEGGVYVASPNANPFGSLLALYLVAQDPFSGVLVKLAGEVHLDGRMGQVVSTFKHSPQLPFEELKLEFFGGPRGPLSTPPVCGTHRSTTSLTPWSGGAPAQSASSFSISSGPDGSPCANPLPFSPALMAGSTNLQAGAFTPVTMTMAREDGNQALAGITMTCPQVSSASCRP
jgi:hypothetical protein